MEVNYVIFEEIGVYIELFVEIVFNKNYIELMECGRIFDMNEIYVVDDEV